MTYQLPIPIINKFILLSLCIAECKWVKVCSIREAVKNSRGFLNLNIFSVRISSLFPANYRTCSLEILFHHVSFKPPLFCLCPKEILSKEKGSTAGVDFVLACHNHNRNNPSKKAGNLGGWFSVCDRVAQFPRYSKR